MKYAIVESGGKQYKAVEGEPIEVDRLPVNAGDKVGLERVLMLVDGEEITVGTPTVSGIQVNTTVMDHFKGPKLIIFKYSPKKRIRVKSGHRQQYTRLMVDVIGKPGETRKAVKAEKAEAPAETKAETKAETEKKVEKKEAAAKEKKAEKAPAKKEAAKKTEKTPAKKEAAKKTEKAPAKKTSASSSKGKKTSSTKTTKK
ncbi:MAG: 50S ribosomal protein L21 [Anaerolineales bacterium]